jgi:nucleoid-associated protein YgaU
MMRFRPLSKLKSYLLPAVAAILLSVGPVGCSSTGEEEPNVELDGAASGEEASENGGNNENSSNSENANENANAEEEGGESNNPLGNELNNAIGGENNGDGENSQVADGNSNEGFGNNAVDNSGEGMNALAAEAATDNALQGFGNDAGVASAADANTSNPFAENSGFSNSSPFPNSAESVPSEPMNEYSAADSGSTGEAGGYGSPTDATGASSEGEGMGSAAGGPKSLPEQGSKMAYYVMRGDTLGTIAQKIYGSRSKWKALQSENSLADANKIYPGDVIYYTLNESSQAFAQGYEMGARQFHTVAAGDTLSRIASKYYGTQGAWRTLWKENPQILNPDRIRVGTTLSFRVSSKVAVRDENDYEIEEAKYEDSQVNAGEDEELPEGSALTAVAVVNE